MVKFGIKIGAEIPFWGSGKESGLSMVLDVFPYTGRFKEFFNCVLVLTAENTRKRQIEMAYNSADWKFDTKNLKEYSERWKKFRRFGNANIFCSSKINTRNGLLGRCFRMV